MAIETETCTTTYEGNESTVDTYPIPWPFLEPEHISVAILDTLDEDAVLTALGPSAFEVLTSDDNPRVRCLTAYPTTTEVVVYRSTPRTQPTIYPTSGSFPARSHEAALDRLTMIAQEVARDSGSGITGATGATGPEGPAPSGTGLVSVTAGVYDTPTTLSAQVAADAANLRTQLGLATVASSGSAADLGTGTLPDARFPTTLPAASGVNLTALNATNLTSGTVPDARFPATLPAASGANLTSLPAGNLTGSIDDARLSANVPLKNAANTFSAANTISVNGAASTPALSLTGTVFTGGTTTSTKPSLLIEPAGATSNAWSTSGTLLGLNAPAGFTGKILAIQKNGTEYINISSSGHLNFGVSAGNPRLAGNGNYLYLTDIAGAANSSYAGKGFNGTSSGTFGWASGSDPAAAPDTILSRESAAVIQQGADSATPITQTFKAPDARAGTDTNTVGGAMNLAAGRGTGTAAGGVLNLQTSEPTTSGTAAQTLTTRLAISGTAITASLPVTLKAYTVATLPTGVVGDTAYVTDATAPTYLGALTGGGSIHCPVFRNATVWVSH